MHWDEYDDTVVCGYIHFKYSHLLGRLYIVHKFRKMLNVHVLKVEKKEGFVLLIKQLSSIAELPVTKT